MVPGKSPTGQMSPGKSPTAQMSPGKSPQYSKLSHQMAIIKAKNPVLEPLRGQMSPKMSPGKSPSAQMSPGKSPSRQMSPGKSPQTSKLSPQRAKNPFLEPIEEDESSENTQRLCRHYRYGNCSFGNSCRYVHADYDDSGSQKERVSQVSVPKPSPSKAKPTISTKDPKKKGMYKYCTCTIEFFQSLPIKFEP
jgi:hypothetical protein